MSETKPASAGNNPESTGSGPYVVPPQPAKKSTVGFRAISFGGYTDSGVFRMAEALFGWKKDESKSAPNGAPAKCIRQSSDIKAVSWSPISSKDYLLQFTMKDESRLPFVGFKESDLSTIQRFLRHHWKLELDITKRATRGWHWGQYDFVGDNIEISINNDPALSIYTSQLKQITANPGKSRNELFLGFDDEDTGPPHNQDLVYEVKLHVIPGNEEGEKAEDGEKGEKKEGENRATHLEYLYDSLLAKSNLTSATASNVAFILEYMNLASPPGRFDIHVVRDGFKLYGKSGNFGPIPWTNVEDVYHLETKPNSCLLLSLNTSLRKGQTSYKNIVIQLDDRKIREISLNLAKDGPTEQRLIDEYKLQPTVRSEEKKLVPKLVAIYGNKKPQRSIIKDPTAENPQPMPAIECSYKQQLGKLSLMSNCIIFAPKPSTILRHEEIALVDFRSPSARTKLFTFRIIMKAPRGSQPIDHSMESIDRSESDLIIKYFVDRNIKTRVGTLEEEGAGPEGDTRPSNEGGNHMNDESEDEDEDFEMDDKNDDSDEDTEESNDTPEEEHAE